MPHDVELVLPPETAPPFDDDATGLVRRAAKKARIDAVAAARVVRVSFDARRRMRNWRVVVRLWEPGEDVPVPVASTPTPIAPPPAGAPRAVVVGSGPAGLFAALEFLRQGWHVTVLERGQDVRARRRPLRAIQRGLAIDPDSNYCFGEGGAGTYSDGKLYTRSGSKRDVRRVLATLVEHGAPRSILVSWRPHIGSNRLPEVVRNLRHSIEAAGGAVRFGLRAEELRRDTERVTGVVARDVVSGALETFDADAVVLATGHSAPDALAQAERAGAPLEPKGFAMGVRIEHPQSWLDQHQYGGLRETCDLPAAFYELAASEHDVWSFCMCPGGFIVPAGTVTGRTVVNGMSLSRRDSPFANSGLVVGIQPEDWCGVRGRAWGWDELLVRARDLGEDVPVQLPGAPGDAPRFGEHLQAALERVAGAAGGGANRAPAQRADAFLAGRGDDLGLLPTSYRPGVVGVDLGRLLPRGLVERLGAALVELERQLPGYAGPDALLVGVESRTSSPVRVARDEETLESPGAPGLHPAGEGAGYAGGIVSAALDGERVARAVAVRRRR
ncbi:MAG: FAD-binding protein [Planctomycetota bacterium]